MRIDSPTGTDAWLTGKFSGSFKGNLEGGATFAQGACIAIQAVTASYLDGVGFARSLDDAMKNPDVADVFTRMILSQKLIISGGIRLASGSVDIDSGSLRIKKVRLEYLDNEDALAFKFVGAPGPEPEPPLPPPPFPPLPPYPPFPPYPPYPPGPWPPFPGPWPPRNCSECPFTGSCPYFTGSADSGSGCKYFSSSLSIDYYRAGNY